MPNYQEKLLDLKNNADLLEELKLVTQADREETVKFNLALAEYLTDIYGSAKKVPSLDAEAQRRFPKEKIKLIDSFISEMRSDIDGYDENGRKPDFYILSGDRLEDAPSLLIKLMEYFCLLHKNRGQLGADDYLWYFEKRGLCDRLYIADKIDRIFVNLQEHCRVYFLNNCQYQKDDELKELLLVKDGEGFEDLYDAVMEKQIIEDAKHYKTFYETLMELAEKREEFRGNPDKLYKAAMLPDEVHNDHKYKVFEDIKKEDVIALVLTLKLDIREAEILLKAAGFQFNDSIIEKFVKSMIITQKWSCGLYNKFSKKYYNMYYTVVNHKDTAEDGSVVLNYRKILMNAARKLGYVKKSAQTVFLENILADGKGSAETALKQIGRDGRCDEELLERLIERLFHLSDIDEIRRCEQEIERHLICVMKQNDQNASKKDKKAAKKYVRPKIGEFILEESKINGGFMRLERQIIFDKLKLFIDLTKLLSEEQLKELKDGISDKTAKWLLYERICDMLSNNSEAGGKNKIYLQIFEACKKSLPSSKKCTAKVLEALTDNKISVNTKGLTESSNLPSIMLALCKYEKGFAEEFGSLFGLNNLADHIEFYYKHSIFEAFDKTFGLRELFAGNFKGCIKDLAQSERCRSKDIIDQVYEDAFGDNYEEMLSRHEAISFDPAQMREEEALALQEQLNMQGLYREKIFVVNYRDKYKNITLRGSAT